MAKSSGSASVSSTSKPSASAKKVSAVKSKAKPTSSKDASAKKITPYTSFMSTELPKVKKANPALSHKDAFKVAAQNWATSPLNPKNGGKAR